MNSNCPFANIATDFSDICDTFGFCFLSPFVQFIFILKEPISTENIASHKRRGCDFYQILTHRRIIWLPGVPPRSFESIVRIVDPIRTANLVAFTKEFDRGGAKSGPTMAILCFLLWPQQRFTYQIGPGPLRITIPCISKVTKSCPGIFPCTNFVIGPCHCLNSSREYRRILYTLFIHLLYKPKSFRSHCLPSPFSCNRT